MPTETADTGDQSVWLSITELAAYLGVKKPTVSVKVSALEADGLIETKAGPRNSKLVKLATYLRATNQVGDAAKEAGQETRDLLSAPDAPASPSPSAAAPGGPSFRDAQTREKELAADLKQLELDERLGKLVPVDGLAQVAEDAAEMIVALIDRLATHAEDMAAAVAASGVPGARAQYRRDARDLRAALAEPFKRLLSISPATAEHRIAALDGGHAIVLWGDLDPAEFAAERVP